MDAVTPIISAVDDIWKGANTILVGVVLWFGRRLVKDIDGKADKEELEKLFKTVEFKADRTDIDDIKGDLRDFIQRQDDMHRDNTKRLDSIIFNLKNGKKET